MKRTSITHPLRIAEIKAGIGIIGLTICPGKQGPSEFGAPWERDLDVDVEAIKDWGAGIVLTLMEAHELNTLNVSSLGEKVTSMGIAWRHLPIKDLNAPPEDFLSHWSLLTIKLQAMLESGQKVLIHCRGGLGRTGLVAALLLIDLGWSADRAIDDIRKARPGAIETPPQERYVLNYLPFLAHASLIAGAMGDSLGADIEFDSLEEISDRFPRGVDTLATRNVVRPGWFTDDTQMTLFTAEGLIEAAENEPSFSNDVIVKTVHAALLRWRQSQSGVGPSVAHQNRGLLSIPEMWYAAAPGNTCMASLAAKVGLGVPANNNSKGCGTIMRVAPIAFAVSRDRVRDVAVATSALTHGHPTGQLAAAAWAELLADVSSGVELEKAAEQVAEDYDAMLGAGCDVAQSIKAAIEAPRDGSPNTVQSLGGGWVAEEALSIALYSALCAESLEHGLRIAVTHSGDSDSTGAIAGNMLGLLYPTQVFNHPWVFALGGKELIGELARKLPMGRRN